MGSAMPTRKVVTTAPSVSKATVAQTVPTAHQCNHKGVADDSGEGCRNVLNWSPSLVQNRCNRTYPAADIRRLRQVVFLAFRRRILVGPAAHDWNLIEVAVRRRRRC